VSLREKLLGLGRAGVPVELPEVGTVYVHRLPLAAEIAALDAGGDLGKAGVIAWYVVRSVRDADGNRLFADEDAGILADTIPGEVVRALWEKVRTVNKLYQTPAEADAEKNGSGATRSGDSPTGSPSPSA
jgi:hypothetical protein